MEYIILYQYIFTLKFATSVVHHIFQTTDTTSNDARVIACLASSPSPFINVSEGRRLLEQDVETQRSKKTNSQ